MNNTKDLTTKELVIIGGGPAGLTAAIYAGRAKRDTLVFLGQPTEGQLRLAIDVDDFPGFPQGITGTDLLNKMLEQIKKFQVESKEENVRQVDFRQYPFKIIGEKGEELRARSVIVATGARHRWLGLPREQELIGHGVSVCAICDGFFFRDKEVAVVGGGDSALEDALYLTKYASKIYIIHRRDSFRAAKILQDEVLRNRKIEVIWDTEVVQLIGDKQLQGVIIHNKRTNEKTELKIEGLFLAIGFQPATDIFQDQLELDEKGYIKVIDYVKTSQEGVFAAGDVCDSRYRQAITAAGLGAMAAIEADRWLKAKDNKNKSK
ncbi:thioredoxin-disulfide reductase [bacterium]|nr:thioredoxin-disulfide reductase [bacterium]